jgi:hypothetical protein
LVRDRAADKSLARPPRHLPGSGFLCATASAAC